MGASARQKNSPIVHRENIYHQTIGICPSAYVRYWRWKLNARIDNIRSVLLSWLEVSPPNNPIDMMMKEIGEDPDRYSKGWDEGSFRVAAIILSIIDNKDWRAVEEEYRLISERKWPKLCSIGCCEVLEGFAQTP